MVQTNSTHPIQKDYKPIVVETINRLADSRFNRLNWSIRYDSKKFEKLIPYHNHHNNSKVTRRRYILGDPQKNQSHHPSNNPKYHHSDQVCSPKVQLFVSIEMHFLTHILQHNSHLYYIAMKQKK